MPNQNTLTGKSSAKITFGQTSQNTFDITCPNRTMITALVFNRQKFKVFEKKKISVKDFRSDKENKVTW